MVDNKLKNSSLANNELQKTSEKDFQGETLFVKLSAKEKLQWLSEAASFAYIVRKK